MERRQVRGSALLLSGRGLDLALSAATQVIIVRVLSKADYGAFAYALALAAIGQTLLSLGQGQLLSRFMAMYEEQRDYARMFGAMFIAVATIAVTSAVAIGALYLWSHQLVASSVHSQGGVKLVLILAFLAPVAALDQVCVALFAVFSRPGAIFVRKYVLAPGLRLAVVLVLAVTGAGVTFVAVGYLVTSAAGLLLYVGVLVVVLRTRGLFGQISPRRVILPFRAVFSFSFPLITSQLAVLSLTVGGVFVLARVHSTTAVADYRSVFTAAQLNTAVQQAFAILFLPLAARLFTRGNIDGLRDSYWHTAAVVAVLTFPIFALTGPLAPVTTVSLFGDRYAASATVLAVLAVGYYINVSLGFNAYALQVCGRIRFLVVVNVAVIIVNLALCWALAPPLSAVGVAVANAVALIGQNVANQWALRRSLRSGFLSRAYLRCYASIAVAAAALYALQLLVHPRVIVAVAAAMAASVVVLAVSRGPLQLTATFPELRRIPLVASARRCIGTARRYIGGMAHTHRRPGRGLGEPGNRHFAHGRDMAGAHKISLKRKPRQGTACREEQARYDHAPPDPDHALPGRSLSAQVGRRAHQERRGGSLGGDPSRPWTPPDDDDTEPIPSAPLLPVPGTAAMAGRRQRRRRPPALVVVPGAALITGIVVGGYLLVHQGPGIQAAPGAHSAASSRVGRAAPAAGRTTTAPPAAAPRALGPASASAIGFTGQPGDNSAQAGLAIDRNPATAWHTDWYTTARFGNLYPGTGLLLDMGRTVTISAVRITLGQPSGAGLQVRVGSGPVPSSMRITAHAANAGGVVHLRPARPAHGRYVLIWFTRLPPDPAGTFLVRVHDIQITGQR